MKAPISKLNKKELVKIACRIAKKLNRFYDNSTENKLIQPILDNLKEEIKNFEQDIDICKKRVKNITELKKNEIYIKKLSNFLLQQIKAKQQSYGRALDNLEVSFNLFKTILQKSRRKLLYPDSYPQQNSFNFCVKNIYLDLLILAKEYPGIIIDEDLVIWIPTEPITLEDKENDLTLDVGQLLVKLSFYPIQNDIRNIVSIIIYPMSSNYAFTDKENSIFHPHIDYHRSPCLGGAHDSIQRALGIGNLLDGINMLISMLKNYNPESPYISLEDWKGAICPICKNPVPNDRITQCRCCGSVMCYNCGYICANCEENVCLDCSISPSNCDCLLCQSCFYTCSSCENILCPDCDCIYSCDSCGETLCENCIVNHKDDTKVYCETCNSLRGDKDEQEEEQNSRATREIWVRSETTGWLPE